MTAFRPPKAVIVSLPVPVAGCCSSICRRRVCFRPTHVPPSCNAAAAGVPAPTPDPIGAITKRIGNSFIAACAPNATPYAAAVGEFVRNVSDAYARGISLAALCISLRLQRRTPAGVSLASDEVELRDFWLSLVYTTLRIAGAPNEPRLVDENDESNDSNGDVNGESSAVHAFVRSIVDARRDGNDLKRIQLSQAHALHTGVERDELQTAILRQSTRLVVAAVDIADELRLRKPSSD